MTFGKRIFFFVIVSLVCCFIIMPKHNHGQNTFGIRIESKFKVNNESLFKLLRKLELKLERNLFKECDMLVLAYLYRIIKDKVKNLDVDRRPDFWYSRQG